MSGSKQAHDWVMLATFDISESEVEQLAAARVDVTGEGRADVQLSQDKMTSLDGPGCRVCGLEWTAGYGVGCEGRLTSERVAEMLANQQSALTLPPPPKLIVPNQP